MAWNDARSKRFREVSASAWRSASPLRAIPSSLFLDEPTVGMDVETRRAFWSDMRAYGAEGRTVLVRDPLPRRS